MAGNSNSLPRDLLERLSEIMEEGKRRKWEEDWEETVDTQKDTWNRRRTTLNTTGTGALDPHKEGRREIEILVRIVYVLGRQEIKVGKTSKNKM